MRIVSVTIIESLKPKLEDTAVKYLLFLIFMVPSIVFSQTTKVSELTKMEQIATYMGYCDKIYEYKHTETADGKMYRSVFDFKNMLDISGLVSAIISREPNSNDLFNVWNDAQNDFTAANIIEPFVLTQEVIDGCIKDGVSIIKDEWVPNFDYHN